LSGEEICIGALDWQAFWGLRAAEPDFPASGRSSGNAGQLFALLADACAALDLKLSDRLLDVGCGVGLLSRHMVPYVETLVGVDFAIPLLGRAASVTTAGCFVAGDLLSLPFREASFSKVIVSSVLQYLDDEASVVRALAEIRRVTAAGGRAFASGNPDRRKKEEYIAGIEALDLPEERKAAIRERNRGAFWLSAETLLEQAKAGGWEAEIQPISSSVWQSFYMFDLVLRAK